MAAKVLLELNDDAVHELVDLCGKTVCAQYAEQVASRSRDRMDVYTAETRTVASVYTYYGDGYEILEALQ